MISSTSTPALDVGSVKLSPSASDSSVRKLLEPSEVSLDTCASYSYCCC